AVLFFAIAFGNGIDMPPSIVGTVQPGFPAWQAGLQPGDRITRIAGREIDTFEDIHRAISFSTGDVEVSGVHPDGRTFDRVLTPDTGLGRRMIGVGPADGLRVIDVNNASEPVAASGTAAAEAQPPFEHGDV